MTSSPPGLPRNALEVPRYFPINGSCLNQLEHLTAVDTGSIRSPFTQEELTAYNRAVEAHTRGTKCMYGCGIASIALGVGTAMIGVGATAVTSTLSRLMLMVGACVTTAGSTGANYVGSGVYPHIASDTANVAQDFFPLTLRAYEEMACQLVQLEGQQKERALQLYENLDEDKLQQAIRLNLSEVQTNRLIRPLLQALEYLEDTRKPLDPLLASALKVRELEKRILRLEAN